MSILLIIFEIFIISIALIMFSIFAFIGIRLYLVFHRHRCKNCNHIMEYKGLKEDDDNGHYLFYCPKCGAWKQVPREEFLNTNNNIDK